MRTAAHRDGGGGAREVIADVRQRDDTPSVSGQSLLLLHTFTAPAYAVALVY